MDTGGAVVDSHNLRDFLRIKDEDRRNNLSSAVNIGGDGGGGGQSNHSGVTLQAILSDKSVPRVEEPLPRVQSNRTLLDIIRDDQTSGYGGAHRDGGRRWRQLKEKILLRRRGGASGWTSTVTTPTSDIPINNNRRMMMTRQSSGRFNSNPNSDESTRPSGRFEHTSSLPRRSLQSEINEVRAAEEGEAEQPVRMSLMSLLAETDRQLGVEGSAYILDEGGEEEEEENGGAGDGDGGVSGGGYNNCCVCMVRHKGAAFIPCGHTFCRLCSRELWAQRGNCPLCNNYILEILDIF
ncbi:hypothetical protein BUALT_Bualt02G0006800 [Buddleja alternifolia]|uniref:RING-type domain-containing protein n=1 Tax=Buddleja alternifolia TaxID=168488 RepID=A0AAV6XYF9_9LAMI|nr:hypothetical protein BUALT_Bualt02G0006800 [Buddleja alternifolia]